jgi:hypothetical protein
MRCLIVLSTVALPGCGHVGAAIARTIPVEYRWIGFVIAAMTFAVWSYGIWLKGCRLQGEHWLLIPLFVLSMLLIFLDVQQQHIFRNYWIPFIEKSMNYPINNYYIDWVYRVSLSL